MQARAGHQGLLEFVPFECVVVPSALREIRMPVLECFQSTFPINLEEGRVSGQAVLSELQQGQIRVLDCVVHGVEDRPKLC